MGCKWAASVGLEFVYCKRFRIRVPIEFCADCDDYEEAP